MKSIRTLATVVAVFGLSGYAQAGLLDHLFGHKGGGSCDGCDASKCCDCAPACEPECCKPVICRPTHKNVYTYQRQISCLKPPACHDPCCDPCDPCCPDVGCAPVGGAPCGAGNCGPCGPGNCGPAAGCCPNPCGANGACGDANGANGQCCPQPAACGPAASCCPTDACCPTSGHHGRKGFFSKLFGRKSHSGSCDGCCDGCSREDAYEVACLIYQSQTACKGSDREEAIDDLGDFDVVCYPEIMAAFIYALNDADPEVRAEAADEIGDALEDNPCLCSECLTAALVCALADCDDDVVGEAEEALEACGYEIVDCEDLDCCDLACGNGCAPGCVPNGCAPSGMPMQQPMQQTAPMGEGQAPAPAPPQDTRAYFPRQFPQGSVQPAAKKSRLSRLFSLSN